MDRKPKKKGSPIHLLDHMEKLAFKERTQISHALRSHSEQKKTHIMQGKYVDVVPLKVRAENRKFNEEYRKVFEQFKEIKNDNNEFAKTYKNAYQSPDKVKQKNDIFNDLISHYRERGYKIPSINIELFDPSPLLMENGKIFDYVTVSDNMRPYEKDMIYLEKLNFLIQDLNSVEPKYRTKKDTTTTSTRSVGFSHQSKLNLLKSIKENELMIERASKLLENKEFLEDLNNHPDIEKKRHASTTTTIGKGQQFSKTPEISRNKNHKTSLIQYIENKDIEIKTKDTKTTTSMTKFDTKCTFSPETNGFPTMTCNKKNEPSFFPRSVPKKQTTLDKMPVSPMFLRKRTIIPQENTPQAIEKGCINKEVEDKIKQHVDAELYSMFEQAKCKDHDYHKTIDFLMRRTGKSKQSFIEGLKSKMEPNDIYKSISETKKIVNSVTIADIHKNFVSRYGIIDINKNNIVASKETDDNINKLEYQLIKKLNKASK